MSRENPYPNFQSESAENIKSKPENSAYCAVVAEWLTRRARDPVPLYGERRFKRH